MEEKILLDYNLNLEFKGRCWDQIRLGIVSLDENYIYWFVDKFLSLHMSSDYIIRSYKWTTLECVKIYEEVLEYKRIENTVYDNLIDTLKQCIRNGDYVIGILDSHIIWPDVIDDNCDSIHDSIIIGFDNTKNVFQVVNPSFRNSIQTIDFDLYKKAFFSAVYKMKTHHLWPYLTGLSPLSTIRPKKIERKKPDVGYLYNLFYYENYCSCNLADTRFDCYATSNEWYGNSIYKGLYMNLLNDLREKRVEITMKILYSIQYFYETRVSLKTRLDFLIKEYNWFDIQNLYMYIQDIIEEWKLIKALFEKYYYSKNEEILERLEKYLKDAEIKDKKIMLIFSRLLEETIVKTLY